MKVLRRADAFIWKGSTEVFNMNHQNKTGKKLYFHLIFWIGTVILVLLDQWSKHLAVIHLKDQPSVSIIPNVFCLEYLENRGAAFGVLQGQKGFFVLITLVFFAAVCWIYVQLSAKKRHIPVFFIMSLFLAGAAGNFIDRMIQNYVVDFFYFELIHFPIFNVADIYVTCGTILFLLMFLFFYKEKELEEMGQEIFPHKNKTKR